MSQQLINIGSAPNDGTGDQLRASFDKCNLNFTELYAGVVAAGPIGNAIEYQFNNSTTEPPASGEIRFNQAIQASTTLLWASQMTSAGINIKQFLSAATTGAKLIIQDKNDNSNYIKFDVTGAPVDKTTYWEFPVAVTASGGTLPNARILAAVTAAAGGGAVAPAIPNYLGGLTLSNDATTPNTVLDIATGSACSNDNTTMMTLLSAVTKNCNAAWAVGSGNGALDSGSFAASTWYHVFLIERTDTGVVDALISTSATSPTMPTSYIKKRRIGSIFTDASAHIVAFTQVGDDFLLAAVSTNANGIGASTTPAALPLSVPPGVKIIAYGTMYFNQVGNLIFASPDSSTVSAPGYVSLIGVVTGNAGEFRIRTNTSAQIFYWATTNIGSGIYVNTRGWIDYRGK